MKESSLESTKSDRHIVAIGGGGFGRSIGKLKIERYIRNLSNSQKPNICFVPTATGDSDSYKVNFYSAFSSLECNLSHIDFFKRTINLEEHISHQDIIYVGGGNTKSMLGVWKEWNFDRILSSAYRRGVIMSGVSAGAICWFQRGITDSFKDDLSIMKCLNFVDGTCCPHFDEEKNRIPYVERKLVDKDISECIAIEGNCALHIKNETQMKSIDFGEGKNSYVLKIKNDKVEKHKIPEKFL